MNKKSLVLVITLCLLVPLLFSSVKAARVLYNFINTTLVSGFYTGACTDAPPFDSGPVPGGVTWNSLPDSSIALINVSDDNPESLYSDPGNYGSFRFNFTLDVTLADIVQMDFVYDGNVTVSGTNVTAWYWDWTNSKWVYMFEYNETADASTYANITSGFSNVVNSTNKEVVWVLHSATADGDFFLDYPEIVVTTSTSSAPSYQLLNDSYTPINAGLRFNFSVAAVDAGAQYMWMQTNETRNWLSYYTRNATAANYSDSTTNNTWFDWSNTYCDRVIGIRGAYNDSAGVISYTDTNTTIVMPYVYEFNSSGLSKDTLNCTNISYAILNTTGVGIVDLTLWMPHIAGAAATPCRFEITNVNRSYAKNMTNYCRVTANLTTSQTRPTFIIALSSRISTVAVSNIPAVITASSILAIIVIYTYVRKKKSEGW